MLGLSIPQSPRPWSLQNQQPIRGAVYMQPTAQCRSVAAVDTMRKTGI